MSKNAFNFRSQSRCDDLIGIVYVLIELVNGILPWAYGDKSSSSSQQEKLMAIKLTLEPSYVATKNAAVFTEVLSLLYTYSYYDRPEYNRIVFLFEKILLDLNIVPSLSNMDWIKRDF